jgi:hypothetical protein
VKPSGAEDLTSLKKAGRDISPFRRNGTAALRSANKRLNPVELCEKLPAFQKKGQSPTLIQNDPTFLNYSAEDDPTDYFCNHNDPPHPALPRAGGREEPKDTATESATNGGVFMILAYHL